MRIISIVTLVSPDGAYGGPTRVAVNQAKALRARGHDVILAAAARGYDELPRHLDDVPVRLFPARTAVPGTGFAGLTSPELLVWLRKALKAADLVHVHAARDLITLPAAWLARREGVPYVLQTHGMIDESGRASAKALDRGLTRPVLRAAGAVFFLTPRERADVLAVNGAELPLVELFNGVPEAPAVAEAEGGPEVLFLARLQSRKRPALFVQMAAALHAEFPEAHFTLVGPDEGEGDEVRRLLDVDEPPAAWEGPLPPEKTIERMSRAAVYVLPSVDEPFPMSVLEAMSLGRPVVITDTCGLAPLVRETGAGIVTDASLESLVEAVRSLLADPEAARRMGEAARQATRDRLTMSAVAERLESVYGALVAPPQIEV